MKKAKEFAIAGIAVIVAAAICFAFSELIGYRVVALILLLVVSLLAVTMDILPVILAAVLSAFIWDFFFIPPRFTAHVAGTEDTILLIMYFIIAMVSGVFTYKIRQAEKVARVKEERANSVKLYNTILNSLSHELRTPIAAIIGATDNIRSNTNLSEKMKAQLIEEIAKASFRLNQQVENLLNISRLESGHIQPAYDWTDIVEVVYNCVQRVEEKNPGRKINISVNQQMPIVAMDKGMLEQILYNLLNNAAVHTENKSEIFISCSSHGDLLEFLVEDSGDSIDKNAVIDVINKFSRDNHPKTSGAGLGLSIAKGFTEALGGKISLYKNSAGGASFNLVFPVKTTQIQTAG
jgi:two-component system, OmpR family, sensor histidine kinase KdpD